MIKLDNVSKIYSTGKREFYSINSVSLKINRGTVNCIFGRSGSGKSTLLRLIGLLDRPSSGDIWINDTNVAKLTETERSLVRLHIIGFVFQDSALIPELNALDNVILPRIQTGDDIHKLSAEAMEIFARVGLTNRARYMPRDLSGGERQRVAIARALINKPSIILADEPTANLDFSNSSKVMQILRSLAADYGITVVFISHDPEDKEFADRTINIRDGKLMSVGTA